MPLVKHFKLGLALLTTTVLLGVAAEAHAGQSGGAAVSVGGNPGRRHAAAGTVAHLRAPVTSNGRRNRGGRHIPTWTGSANTTGNADRRTHLPNPTRSGHTNAPRHWALHGSGGLAGGSGDAHLHTGAAESNTTTQAIRQVQISGCTAHCHGTSQTQLASQRNITVQVVNGAPKDPIDSRRRERMADPPNRRITHLQVGCLSHCFGSTTTSAGIPGRVRQALEHLVGVLARKPPSKLAGPRPAPAIEQNTVRQTAAQWQRGQRQAVVQRQSASQANGTVQVGNLSSSLAAELEAGQRTSEWSTGETFNQTRQGIWQLQIGCVLVCVQTQQYQRAEQSNTTVQVRPPAPDSSEATTDGANLAHQLLWQLQIGCVSWCTNATEHQTAASRQRTLVVTTSPSPKPAPPVHTTGPPRTTSAPSRDQPVRPTANGDRSRLGSVTHIAAVSDTLPTALTRDQVAPRAAASRPLSHVPGIARNGIGLAGSADALVGAAVLAPTDPGPRRSLAPSPLDIAVFALLALGLLGSSSGIWRPFRSNR
jgi:hypothetical protein